jgi:hypothetical protein
MTVAVRPPGHDGPPRGSGFSLESLSLQPTPWMSSWRAWPDSKRTRQRLQDHSKHRHVADEYRGPRRRPGARARRRFRRGEPGRRSRVRHRRGPYVIDFTYGTDWSGICPALACRTDQDQSATDRRTDAELHGPIDPITRTHPHPGARIDVSDASAHVRPVRRRVRPTRHGQPCGTPRRSAGASRTHHRHVADTTSTTRSTTSPAHRAPNACTRARAHACTRAVSCRRPLASTLLTTYAVDSGKPPQ